MTKINLSVHTDTGDIKETNQDSVLTLTGVMNKHDVGLFIVADGCGGLEYGEVVSKLIVKYFAHVWESELPNLIKPGKVNLNDVNDYLNALLDDINQKALDFGEQASSKVGSTLSLLLTIDKRYIIKNIGDSRIYLKKGKKIVKLTEDQSLVADMLRNGEITEDEAKNFNRKNVLTMCIGFYPKLQVYTKLGKIKNKNTFILCCDGFHNHISPDSIMRVLCDKRIEFGDKAYELRRLIEPGKANDNVSSVICEFRQNNIFGISAVALLALAILFVLWLLKSIA
ncbi:MAG: serine/threonine-protein phosphatase [Clostridia bacterium]|nr:serine/threonine-protein phosphatase [Clostridia bacterium]